MEHSIRDIESENEKLITLKYRKFRKNLIRKVTLSYIKKIKGILGI